MTSKSKMIEKWLLVIILDSFWHHFDIIMTCCSAWVQSNVINSELFLDATRILFRKRILFTSKNEFRILMTYYWILFGLFMLSEDMFLIYHLAVISATSKFELTDNFMSSKVMIFVRYWYRHVHYHNIDFCMLLTIRRSTFILSSI